VAEPDLVRFRSAVAGALGGLEARRQEVNDLNVFPVADGDTGDNMVLTLRAMLVELDRLAQSGRSADEIGRDEIVESVARAALLGARGNSGVILSQLIRGAAEELVSRPGELVDPVLIGAAMARAADRAYTSVRDPAEGTMLTVAREMAHRVASELAHMPRTRLESDASAAEQDRAIAEVLERAVTAGRESVARSPEHLAVLREAGVVDAGGHAVTIVFAGIVAALRGTEAPAVEHHTPARATQPQHRSSTYRYCTNFALSGGELDAAELRTGMDALGDSVLVVGDQHTLKVHLHTDDPERATELAEAAGQVSHVDVADMREQERERDRRLSSRDSYQACCALVAVVAGAGMRALFEGLGVQTLDGGPTLNPSTLDLLTAIHSAAGEQVVVLPNSPNVIMAAERAAELSDRTVVVVPSRSQQAGLAAAVAFAPGVDAPDNAAALGEALTRVRIGSVAPAARDDRDGRFRAGEGVGFVGEELIAWGEPEPTLRRVLKRLADGAELVTCIAGADAPLDRDRIVALAPTGVELECPDGGQPGYWWLLSAE
jgi:uncharacterized protein